LIITRLVKSQLITEQSSYSLRCTLITHYW